MGYKYELDSVHNLPRVIFIFEEADTYFDSASLNKKDPASFVLRDFIKVGRNFGLRGICIVTACAGELGTKLRRRATHLIGKILSDEDLRYYNRRSKGLGNLATETKPYHWIYYNGSVHDPFSFDYHVFPAPQDYVVTGEREFSYGPEGEVKEASGMDWRTGLIVILLFLLGWVWLVR